MAYGAYGDLTPNKRGLFYGSLINMEFAAKTAKASMDFGDPAFGKEGDETYAYLPVSDEVTVTLSGALVTSNVITSIVKLAGVALTTVATTYATSSADTLAAHIASLTALTGITVTAGDTNQFVVAATTAGQNVSVSTVVTLGASQATASYTYDSSLFFDGMVPISHTEVTDEDGSVVEKYPANLMVDVMKKGGLWVSVPTGVTSVYGKEAYIIINSDDANYKSFTTDSANFDSGCKFVTDVLNGYAAIRVLK